MKTKVTGLLTFLIGTFFFHNCDTDVEALGIQKLKAYDEQYFKNLRAFKKSDHGISYAYYKAWSPIEGVTGYKDPTSQGERMVGLPDSIDIVSLWMRISITETHLIAYADTQYYRWKLGTCFVMHANVSHYRHQSTVDGVDYDLSQNEDDEAMAAYAEWITNQVLEPGLDGADTGWEGWSGSDLVRLIKELDKYFGPKGEQPDKLLIVNYFSETPPTSIIPYCDYIIRQAYSDRVGFLTQPSNFPPEKMIYYELFEVLYADEGQLMNYARWEPSKGRKGGCGVFYLGRNYYSSPGAPYNEFREAIQIVNPAVNE